jgi:receptor protein-tyrosine kinase
MSLIEQAAKRLAELQRAGVETPAAPAPGTPASSATRTPTPEAIVDELNAAKIAALRSGVAAPAPPQRTPAPAAFVPAQKVEIDLLRLQELGLVTPDNVDSWTAHELRVLKRPILRNVKEQANKAIANANRVMVTSALPGEGKTFTAANLALSIAMELEDAVLLIDGDVAHPKLLQLLGVRESPGLLDLLSRPDAALEDFVVQTNLDRLMLLPAGMHQRRATELLASDRMSQLMDTLASRLPGHIIIFDSPPLLPTTEARVLATHAGQIVMVVAADSTSRQAVEEALATIERCECVMMLLNKAEGSGGAYSYGYGYRPDAASAD